MGREKDEFNLTYLFMQKAGVRHNKCPEVGDYSTWLYLMQHYHLPTRLLDWSESALVGLYFAVADKKNHSRDGALFGLSPGNFNLSQINKRIIINESSIIAMPVFQCAFSDTKTKDSEKILAILSNHSDIRQMVQHSAFTIHGKSTPLDELDESEDFLCKIEIPSKAKPSLLAELEFLDINRSSLFPDLENLAKELKSWKFS